MRKRDIRKSQWFEDVEDFFNIPADLLRAAVSDHRIQPEDESTALKKAREEIRMNFMSEEARKWHDRIQTDDVHVITDLERSTSWREYIFLCINGERRCFQRMAFYDLIIDAVIIPMLKKNKSLTVLDYGCGSSLFTRLLSQDFKGKVTTISSDVCKYSINFALTRNRLYNPNAYSVLIDDVMSIPEFKKPMDVILAYAVFEHLPNSTLQIQGIIDSLSVGGILIENYSGFSGDIPHKSDTFNAYKQRDVNLDMLCDRLNLLYGVIPKKKNGVYEKNNGNRFWIKGEEYSDLTSTIRKGLARKKSLFAKIKKVLSC